jgi:tryptophanyl-tRNA synthetase
MNSSSSASEPPSKILYSIVGLHAITMPQDPKVLKRERREALACLLACGVGPGGSLDATRKRATLFFQEEVSISSTDLEIASGRLILYMYRCLNMRSLHGISTR